MIAQGLLAPTTGWAGEGLGLETSKPAGRNNNNNNEEKKGGRGMEWQ